MKTNSRAGVGMVLAAAALWGTTGTAQTFSSGNLSPMWFGALRLLVAALFFLACAAVVAHRRTPAPSTPRLRTSDVLAAGVCTAVYNLAFFAGIRETGVAIGTAVALGSGPVWAGILQSVVARQVPPRGWWIGTALAVGGGVLMTTAGAAQVDPAGSAGPWATSLMGIALCLLSGLSYAAYSMVNRRLVQAAPAATVTLRSFAVAAVLALPAAWLDAGPPQLQGPDLGAVLYVGVVTAGVSYLMFTQALRYVSVATAVTLALAEPVVAFLLSVWVIGEQPSAWAWAGGVALLAGVLAVIRAELQAAPAGRPVHPTAAPLRS